MRLFDNLCINFYSYTSLVSVMYLSFEASSVVGTRVQNVGIGGSAYNGQLVNGASISTTDYKGGAASLQLSASASQYVILPVFSTGSTGLSFAFWFRSNGNGVWARLFDLGNGAGIDNILVFINAGNLGVSVYLGTTVNQYTNVYPNVNDNIWRRFVWTLSVSGVWTVYINGVVVWSMSGQTYPSAISRSLNYIGKSNWNDPYFTGAVDEFKMYNSVLTQDDICK